MNWKGNKNIFNWIRRREYEANSIHKKFQRALHVTHNFADRLGLEKELKGHSGCVNCLEWNEDGSLLVSGSDDLNIIVWEALTYRSSCVFNSGHSGNIFSVKFLPSSNSSVVASGAADANVRIHNVHRKESTHVYSCHFQRVKRLAVVPHMPFMVWSGSEDGTIRQFDLRQPHSCAQQSRCSNIIINLNSNIATSSEAKCISINPMRPELIAVGCGDPFTRIYDTRMLTMHSIHDARGKSNGRKVDEVSPPDGCVSYFSPGHIPQRYGRDHPQKYRHYVITYLTFSPDGTEILTNLGGEHVYMFDINSPRDALRYSARQSAHHHHHYRNGATANVGATNQTPTMDLFADFARCDQDGTATGLEQGTKTSSHVDGHQLSNQAQELKSTGNDCFSKHQFYQAICYYNKALSLAPKSAILEGDIYAALSDCCTALRLDPQHSKAHYRQARCLYELQWYQEAMHCLNDFKCKFPDQADGYSTKKLERDIRASTVSEAEDAEKDNSNNSSSVPKRRRRRPHPAPSESERMRQEKAFDYNLRFVGACNTTTDIKEASFFGGDAQFIVAGSDCGCMFLWDRATTNLIEAWHGDESIVNCLQPHPTFCLLATSGIDPVVRLWAPRSKEDATKDPRREKELEGLVRANQKRMNADPLEVMLMNMGYRARIDGDRESDSEDEASDNTVQCRTH
eukprot:gene171-783_t